VSESLREMLRQWQGTLASGKLWVWVR
jgi:hypothetical protein